MTVISGYTGRLKVNSLKLASACIQDLDESRNRSSDLNRLSEIDRAHIVMLVKSGLMSKERAATILSFIATCRSEGFHKLVSCGAPRGLYLMWEGYLIDALGQDVAGSIHLARSRNDINATDVRMRLRAPCSQLMQEVMRLAAVLLVRSRRFRDTTMPIYTHFQAAQAVSYGHYLAGLLQAVLRIADCIIDCVRDGTDRCPLGAGAVGGTSIPIAPTVTAELLGFSRPVRNSIDAIASRDFVLRLLGELTILGTLLSRLATDLQLWSTSEFGFIHLPDGLVGSSSMMPQKRNPYLLEHIQGQSGRMLGWFTAAVTAMHAKPFSNNLSASYEATLGLWDALRTSTNSTKLARLMFRGATPSTGAMLRRAEHSMVEATEIANRLLRCGRPFRSAHEMVGAAITEAAEEDKTPIGQAVISRILALEPSIDVGALDAASVMRASSFGGGPGDSDQWDDLNQEVATMRRLKKDWKSLTRQWENGAFRLEQEVSLLIGGFTTASESDADKL